MPAREWGEINLRILPCCEPFHALWVSDLIETEDAHTKTLSTFEADEHLQALTPRRTTLSD